MQNYCYKKFVNKEISKIHTKLTFLAFIYFIFKYLWITIGTFLHLKKNSKYLFLYQTYLQNTKLLFKLFVLLVYLISNCNYKVNFKHVSSVAKYLFDF